MSKEYKISKELIRAIEKALESGHRVELIPVKDGIKPMLVRKNELKTD